MNAKMAGKISKALSDPSRLTILKELRKQKSCLYCADIGEVLTLAQPSISHHFKLLTDAEIIIAEKEGRQVKYTLNEKMLDDYIQFLEDLKKS